MILTYDAIDGQGHEKNDIIEATNPVEAAEMLRARGLYVTRITEQKNPMARAVQKEIPKSQLKLPLKTVGIFTRQMAMLLNAGSSVVPAVTAIKRQMRKPAQIQLLASIVHDVEEGATLTEALRKFPQTFDSVYCAIIAAGEASGTLGEMFERLARIVGSRRNMRNKIIGALIYPALLIVMSVKILMVLLFFVLPRFGDMFRQLDVQPPAMTQVLLNLGTTLREQWYWVLAVALTLLGGIIWVDGSVRAHLGGDKPLGTPIPERHSAFHSHVRSLAFPHDPGAGIPHAGHAAGQQGRPARSAGTGAGRDQQQTISEAVRFAGRSRHLRGAAQHRVRRIRTGRALHQPGRQNR